MGNDIDAVVDDLAQEIIDRQAGDTTLQNNIDVVANGLAQEVLDRQAGDTTLQNNINVVAGDLAEEIIDRQLAIATLGTSLGNDIDAVANNLAQEIIDRQASDTTLQNNINVVAGDLAQEILDRQASDTILQNNINSVVGDLAQEILDRQQADQGIQDALDLFQDEVIFEINNIEFGIGLDPDGTYQAPESNYLEDTESVVDALQVLDTQVKSAFDTISMTSDAIAPQLIRKNGFLDQGINVVIFDPENHIVRGDYGALGYQPSTGDAVFFAPLGGSPDTNFLYDGLGNIIFTGV